MAEGFMFFGGNADNSDVLSWLLVCGTAYSSGPVTGNLVDEDELILDSLARESKIG